MLYFYTYIATYTRTQIDRPIGRTVEMSLCASDHAFVTERDKKKEHVCVCKCMVRSVHSIHLVDWSIGDMCVVYTLTHIHTQIGPKMKSTYKYRVYCYCCCRFGDITPFNVRNN